MTPGREEGKIYWLREFERKASEVKEAYRASGWRTPNSLRARMKVVKRLLDTALKHVGAHSPVVLDLGCGPGSYLPLISELANTVVALDLSPGMASRAKKAWPKALVCVGDAEQLPFRDGVFHIIICVGLLQYLDGAEKALSEIARTVKKGGAAIIITLNREYGLGRPAGISITCCSRPCPWRARPKPATRPPKWAGSVGNRSPGRSFRQATGSDCNSSCNGG